MTFTTANLETESLRATELLRNKVIARVARARSTEVLVEFTDGGRLFAERADEHIELSITSGAPIEPFLTADQAYLAMFAFLENQFSSTSSDDIGALLGSLSLLPDGSPADPAHRKEWASAIHAVLSGKVNANQSFSS